MSLSPPPPTSLCLHLGVKLKIGRNEEIQDVLNAGGYISFGTASCTLYQGIVGSSTRDSPH